VALGEGEKPRIRITRATIGKIIDFGIKDANNMGGAMAPAAADTLLAHFYDFACAPDDYDVIATGDLGYVGHHLLPKLMARNGVPLNTNYMDCGMQIYDRKKQDTHSGGSGPACSAAVFCSYLYKKMEQGDIKRLLFVPTGALLSQTTTAQKASIPCIAHAVVIETV
jgi:stage V sporulation protein AD